MSFSAPEAVLVADIGSSTLKAAIVTSDGRCLHRRSAPTVGGPDIATQDQEALWERTADVLAQVVAASSDPVDAIVVTGQGDGLWTIDRFGHGGIARQWNSVAGASTVEGWERSGIIDDHFRRTGTVLWPGTSAALWSSLRQSDPDVARSTRWILTAADWVTYRLSGCVATDVTNATIPFLDPWIRNWDGGSFSRLGCPELADLVPPVLQPGAPAGTLTRDAADRLGLPARTPVHIGCIDVVAQALGSGMRQEGDAVAVLGTTIAVTPLTRNPSLDGEPVGATVAWIEPGLHLRVLGSSAGGAVLDWFLDLHGYEHEDRYERFWADVASSHSESEIVLPFLYGERVPFLAPEATGAFTGLTPTTRRADLARALAEGLTMALRQCAESTGASNSLILTGGGASTPQWCQLVADVLNRPVIADTDPAAGMRGAASVIPGLSHLREVESRTRTFTPSDRTPILAQHYRRYQHLIDVLAPTWKESA